MTNTTLSIAAMCAALLALANTACSKPEPVPPDDPPEPQAAQLHEAIRAPIDRAKAAGEAVQDAADEQRAAIDAAAGG